MGKFRAVCFDGRGKVWVEDKLGAESIEEAVAKARVIKDAVKIEIRDESRLITVIDRTFPTL